MFFQIYRNDNTLKVIAAAPTLKIADEYIKREWDSETKQGTQFLNSYGIGTA